MSYQEALEAAGAEILAYEVFGSYQGDWWAKVRYKGNLGWAHGSFGSCPQCDAFESEFEDNDACSLHYKFRLECPDCQKARDTYETRLAEFGRGYLDGLLLNQDEAEKEASKNTGWDIDAEGMLKWLKINSLEAKNDHQI